MNYQNKSSKNHTDTPQDYVNNDNVSISVRNVSKMYPLYANPRDRLRQSLWYARPKFMRGDPPEFYKEFWALHKLSFEVKRGEVVGVVGRNGAGKSTLLQIIAGTLTPTTGEVHVNGQAAALLELNSGFNQEFTGRENVYMNGAIRGLRPAEIDNIFDDIAAFADIGSFMDQPVKLYSSGMRVRLAFAVQTFVPKEVLIIDEALAVGDPPFKYKCWTALDEFVSKGGTVLMVSHSVQTIVRVCQRCLILSQGKLLVDGPSKPVTDLYQRILFSTPQDIKEILTNLRQHGLDYAVSHSLPPTEDKLLDEEPLEGLKKTKDNEEIDGPDDWFDSNMPQPNEVTYGNGQAKISEYAIYNTQGKQVNVLITGRRYRLVYRVHAYQDIHHIRFGMQIKTNQGARIAGINNDRERVEIGRILASSIVEVSFSFKLNIAPGNYFLTIQAAAQDADEGRVVLHRRGDVCMIRVLPRDEREVGGFVYMEPTFAYSITQAETPALTKPD